MPAIYSNTIKNARCNVVLAAIDAVGAGGVLIIGDSSLNGGGTGILATVPFAKPSFSIVNGVMTALGLPFTASASGTGNAAKAEIRDGAGVVIMSGLTVGLAGATPDVIINTVALSTGQTIQCTLGSITHG